MQRNCYDLGGCGTPKPPPNSLLEPSQCPPVAPSAPSMPHCPQFHAMDTLQRNGYDLARAMATLVPQGGPVLCRDEMEEWSASEAMLFEEALEKYGKDFNDIRQDFVSGGGSFWGGSGTPSTPTPPRAQGLVPAAALEVAGQHRPVLLHVENH